MLSNLVFLKLIDLGFEPLFIAFLAGAMAMALTNGGIGVYPLAIAAVISQYEMFL